MQISSVTLGRYNNNFNKENEQNKALSVPLAQKSTMLPDYRVAFGSKIFIATKTTTHISNTLTQNQYLEKRKEFEKDLKSNTDFPQENIAGILKSTNKQNLPAKLEIYSILKNATYLVKEDIPYLLYHTNEKNISLTRQLFADKDFPKEHIAEILDNTNDKNLSAKLEIYSILKNASAATKDYIPCILHNTNEKNISLTRQLFADNDFPKECIAEILDNTNDKNLSAKLEIYSILKNATYLAKEAIPYLLYNTNEKNISLTRQLFADKDFPKEYIPTILSETNEKNLSAKLEIYSTLKNITDAPKDYIVYILHNTNEKNISLIRQLFADKDFPKDDIPGILNNTNEENISLIWQLLADKDFPKKYIAEILDNTNDKNLSAKLEIYSILKSASAATKDYSPGILHKTNEKNISLAKPLILDDYVPKNDIAELLEATKKKNLSTKLEMYNRLKNDPNVSNGSIAHILYFTEDKNLSAIKQLLDEKLPQEMIQRRNIIKSGIEDLSDGRISGFVANNANNILVAKEILGESAFIDSFGLKTVGMADLFEKCSILKEKLPAPEYEQILQLFNPAQSTKGKHIDAIVQKLRKQNQELAKIPELDIKKTRMDHITNRLKQLKTKVTQMQAQINSISNKEKFSKLKTIAAIAKNNPNDATKFIRILKADKNVWNNAVNRYIFKSMNIGFNNTISTKLGLENSEYISEILSGDSDFKENFKSLVEVIAKHPDKTIQEALDTLPQNIETKRVFEKLGLNYDKWVSFDENSFEIVTVTTDANKAKQAAINSLESDFNDTAFKSLPKEETSKIINALKEAGFTLKEQVEAIYDDAGFAQGTRKHLRLYANNTPIKFNQLEKAIKIIKEVMNKEAFWSTTHSDETLNQAKNNVYEHIAKLRHNEVNITSRLHGKKTTEIKVRKADMNNISHSLFLGNHSSCCTAIGTGWNQFTAPTYIKNKLVSAIEVIDDKNSVGNTMCYIAKVEGKPSLILDNIELSAQYQYNEVIRDAIFKYAKRLVAEIGAPDMPIYAGPHRHKVNIDASTLSEKNIKILGSSGDDKIYIDYKGRYKVNGKSTLKNNFYKITS